MCSGLQGSLISLFLTDTDFQISYLKSMDLSNVSPQYLCEEYSTQFINAFM